MNTPGPIKWSFGTFARAGVSSHVQTQKVMRLFVCLSVSAMLLMACETPEDCEVTFGERVAKDTLFFGKWTYKFTISRMTLTQFTPPIVADDTIFVGETRTWMPTAGHPFSQIIINPSYFEAINLGAFDNVGIQNGGTCLLEFTSKEFTTSLGDSIIKLRIDNSSQASSIEFGSIFLLLFNIKHTHFVFIRQDPDNDYAIYDHYPNTETYDYYEREQ